MKLKKICFFFKVETLQDEQEYVYEQYSKLEETNKVQAEKINSLKNERDRYYEFYQEKFYECKKLHQILRQKEVCIILFF